MVDESKTIKIEIKHFENEINNAVNNKKKYLNDIKNENEKRIYEKKNQLN